MRWILVLLLPAFAGLGCSAGAGPDLDAAREAYAANCSACHAPNGGGGVGPALDHVDRTFPDRTDAIDFVLDGPKADAESYGATSARLDEFPAIHPPFADVLSREEVVEILAYVTAAFSSGRG